MLIFLCRLTAELQAESVVLLSTIFFANLCGRGKCHEFYNSLHGKRFEFFPLGGKRFPERF